MKLIAVTGMHRSGTSLLAGVVQILGVGFGRDDALLPATTDNPKGYFENERIVQFGDALLGHLGGWWHVPPVLDEDWAYQWELEPFRVWGAQLVADHLSDAPTSGFKDPRVSLLLPFWRTVAVIDRTVQSLRHPVAVAGSLGTRDGFAAEHSAYLWLRYVTAASHHDAERLDVFYDDWFDHPRSTAQRVAAVLGVEDVDSDTMRRIVKFVAPDLRRQSTDDPTARRRGPWMARAVDLYDAMRTGSASEHDIAMAFEEVSRASAPT
jgi:hypothetical protein